MSLKRQTTGPTPQSDHHSTPAAASEPNAASIPRSTAWAEGPLNDQQIEQFITDGYTVLREAVPTDVCQRLTDRMWAQLDIDPLDEATWPESRRLVPSHLDQPMSEGRTPRVQSAIGQLFGDNAQKDGRARPVLVFPTPGPQTFQPGNPHLDGRPERQVTLAPLARYGIILIYLSDTDIHGGATAVWPNSHRRILAHYHSGQSEPDLNDGLPKHITDAKPVPVPARAGDVLFMHYLMAHAGSKNHAGHIRLALNAAIKPRQTPFMRTGSPAADWTPLEHTLG